MQYFSGPTQNTCLLLRAYSAWSVSSFEKPDMETQKLNTSAQQTKAAREFRTAKQQVKPERKGKDKGKQAVLSIIFL